MKSTLLEENTLKTSNYKGIFTPTDSQLFIEDKQLDSPTYAPKIKSKYRPQISTLIEKKYEQSDKYKNKSLISDIPLTETRITQQKYKLNGLLDKGLNDFFIICKENRIENPTSFYGCFYLGPFEPGQGLTIGNTLRRTLLATISGLAITAVEIEGVSHEYSAIPGVKETVLDLLLALNDTVFTISNIAETPKKALIGYLKKAGPGVIYARDLRLPKGIKCVNPNHYIATLSDKGFLNIKFQLQVGKSWTEIKGQNWFNPPKEQNSIYIDSIVNATDKLSNQDYIDQPWSELYLENDKNQGFNKESSKLNSMAKNYPFYSGITSQNQTQETLPLLLNPIFNPIKKVNYLVDHYKDLQENVVNSSLSDESKDLYYSPIKQLDLFKTNNNYDVVNLEIWTNGSIQPRDALSQALRNCITTYSKLSQIEF
jgi:DNA-directed RNA polymerase alpha subunit